MKRRNGQPKESFHIWRMHDESVRVYSIETEWVWVRRDQSAGEVEYNRADDVD